MLLVPHIDIARYENGYSRDWNTAFVASYFRNIHWTPFAAVRELIQNWRDGCLIRARTLFGSDFGFDKLKWVRDESSACKKGNITINCIILPPYVVSQKMQCIQMRYYTPRASKSEVEKHLCTPDGAKDKLVMGTLTFKPNFKCPERTLPVLPPHKGFAAEDPKVKSYEGQLQLMNYGISVPLGHLTDIGRSTKPDQKGMVGRFGEGFKLAVGCLVTDTKHYVKVETNRARNIPYIDRYDRLRYRRSKTERLQDIMLVTIEGLTAEELGLDSYLFLQKRLHKDPNLFPCGGDSSACAYITLNPLHQGRLSCNLMPVSCEKSIWNAGYDLPDLSLNRDRTDFTVAWPVLYARVAKAWLDALSVTSPPPPLLAKRFLDLLKRQQRENGTAHHDLNGLNEILSTRPRTLAWEKTASWFWTSFKKEHGERAYPVVNDGDANDVVLAEQVFGHKAIAVPDLYYQWLSYGPHFKSLVEQEAALFQSIPAQVIPTDKMNIFTTQFLPILRKIMPVQVRAKFAMFPPALPIQLRLINLANSDVSTYFSKIKDAKDAQFIFDTRLFSIAAVHEATRGCKAAAADSKCHCLLYHFIRKLLVCVRAKTDWIGPEVDALSLLNEANETNEEKVEKVVPKEVEKQKEKQQEKKQKKQVQENSPIQLDDTDDDDDDDGEAEYLPDVPQDLEKKKQKKRKAEKEWAVLEDFLAKEDDEDHVPQLEPSPKVVNEQQKERKEKHREVARYPATEADLRKTMTDLSITAAPDLALGTWCVKCNRSFTGHLLAGCKNCISTTSTSSRRLKRLCDIESDESTSPPSKRCRT